MHNNGRLSFGMCGIKTASVTLALVWWLAPAAIVNAQQPDPDRPTQPRAAQTRAPQISDWARRPSAK
jgi:hypothetical protein